VAWAVVVALMRGFEGRWLAVAAVVVIGAVLLDALVYRWRPRAGVMLAFPCAAVSVGVLAVGWVAGVAG
jgi:hypothetical protein